MDHGVYVCLQLNVAQSDSLSAAEDGESDDRDVKWNSFFFADTRAFFLQPFLAAFLPVLLLPLDNPAKLKHTTVTSNAADCKNDKKFELMLTRLSLIHI